MSQDLPAAFAALKTLLASYAHGRHVVHDEIAHYYLNSARIDVKGKPVFFGAVKIGAGKVVFHLMPVYEFPALLDGISSDLKKRMQGKSCFNFKVPDVAMMEELGALIDACANADAGAKL